MLNQSGIIADTTRKALNSYPVGVCDLCGAEGVERLQYNVARVMDDGKRKSKTARLCVACRAPLEIIMRTVEGPKPVELKLEPIESLTPSPELEAQRQTWRAPKSGGYTPARTEEKAGPPPSGGGAGSRR